MLRRTLLLTLAACGLTAAAEPLASIGLKITSTESNGKKKESPASLELHEGDDPEHAAFRFCAAHGLGGAELKGLADQLVAKIGSKHGDERAAALPRAGDLGSSDAHEKRGRTHAAKGRFTEAAVDFSRAGQHDKVTELARGLGHWEASTAHVAAEDWEAANAALEGAESAGPQMQASEALMARRAKVYFELGKFPAVTRTCGRVLRKASHRGNWRDGQPRLECARLGGLASLEMGDAPGAKKIMGVALRADPEASVKGLFGTVKKLTKLLKDANKWLDKSYNHRALEKIQAAEKLIKETLQLKTNRILAETSLLACRVESAIKHHELAIERCEDAEKFFGEAVEGLVTDPFKLIMVREKRADAHMNDNNYDEAVTDYRAALTMLEEADADRQRRNEMTNKWRRAQHEDKMWQEKRDHAKVLDLPVNINELQPKSRCKWLKKQHRKMVMKWHPDKAKGNKKRAVRKFSEVAEAATELDMQWNCSAKGRTAKREKAEDEAFKRKREAEERRKNGGRGRQQQQRWRRGPR
jgi:tetratricopeptide (TPR) repeat protein